MIYCWTAIQRPVMAGEVVRGTPSMTRWNVRGRGIGL
jgi:hypothetical protein